MKATFLLGAEFGYATETVECDAFAIIDRADAMVAVILPPGWDESITFINLNTRYVPVCADYLNFANGEALPELPEIDEVIALDFAQRAYEESASPSDIEGWVRAAIG